MNEQRLTPTPEIRDAYRDGVQALLEGRLEDAARDLAHPADAGIPEAILALAKVHLEQKEGAQAHRRLEELLDPPPAEIGLRAYLLLLDASAAALDDRRDVAFARLEEAASMDRSLENAARALRRRIEKGRLPVIRF